MTTYYTHGYSYVHGIGTMVAAKKQESSTTYYQFGAMDHRGSVYRLTNEDNEVVATYEYNAFGEPLQNDNAGATNRYMYQSNWISLKDSGDEIVLSPSRLYSTATGQFLQKDFLLEMTLLERKGMYWNSIFRERQHRLFEVNNYGLYGAFKANPYKHVDIRGKDANSIGDGAPSFIQWNTIVRTKVVDGIVPREDSIQHLSDPYFGSSFNDQGFILPKDYAGTTLVKFEIEVNCCCNNMDWQVCGSVVDFHINAFFNASNIKLGISEGELSNFRTPKLMFPLKYPYYSKTSHFWMLARDEAEHINDFKTWATNSGENLADKVYKSLEKKSWNTQKSCEINARRMIYSELWDSVRYDISSSVKIWDETGVHNTDSSLREKIKKEGKLNRNYTNLIEAEQLRSFLSKNPNFIIDVEEGYNTIVDYFFK